VHQKSVDERLRWQANFLELRKSEVQLRRILLPRTPVNKFNIGTLINFDQQKQQSVS
jgi:hypothetical protein